MIVVDNDRLGAIVEIIGAIVDVLIGVYYIPMGMQLNT